MMQTNAYMASLTHFTYVREQFLSRSLIAFTRSSKGENLSHTVLGAVADKSAVTL